MQSLNDHLGRLIVKDRKEPIMTFLSFILSIALFVSPGCGAQDQSKQQPAHEIKHTDVKNLDSNSVEIILEEKAESQTIPPTENTIESTSMSSKKVFSHVNADEKVNKPVGNTTTNSEELTRDNSASSDVIKEPIKSNVTTGPSTLVNDVSDTIRYNEKDNDVTFPVSETEQPIVQKLDEDGVSVHDAWNDILQKFVSSKGVVDYSGLKRQVTLLDDYLKLLNSNVPKLTDKSLKAKAFWMNAYNAFTVKLILNNFPVKSIRDIDNGSPWDTEWINLGGKKYSLNNIEHDIIRKVWKDGRIHFAVNCAAKSCPPLGNMAFTEKNADEMLDELTRNFIANSNFNQVTVGHLRVSKIFEWYKEDFGDLVQFIDKYTTIKLSSKAQVTYNEYNWSLNGQ